MLAPQDLDNLASDYWNYRKRISTWNLVNNTNKPQQKLKPLHQELHSFKMDGTKLLTTRTMYNNDIWGFANKVSAITSKRDGKSHWRAITYIK